MDFEVEEYVNLSFDGEINSYLIRYTELYSTLHSIVDNELIGDDDFRQTLINNLDEEMKYIIGELKRVYKEMNQNGERNY